MAKLTKFKSGLRLVTSKIEGMYSFALGVWVGAGSSDETLENNGISHFIEHMLFKGTKKRSSFDITDAVDRLGAQINAFTSKECTCYYMKATEDHTEESFDILSDMLFNSVFDAEEMEREKNVVLEEISMVEDTPEDICIDMLAKAYFGKHALGKTIIGSSQNVSGFTRKDIESYMQKQYDPSNIVISVAGNFDEEKVLKLTEKYFANGFKTPACAHRDRAPQCRPLLCYERKNKEIEQAHIAFAFKNVPFSSAEIEKNLVACNILGGGMSSRLFQSVREKQGLAYSVYSYVSTYKHNGVLVIYAAVNPKNVCKSAATIREEIDKLLNKGITADEFERSKQQLKGAFIMSQEQTSSVMNACGKYMVISDKLYDMNEKITAMDAITPEDVQKALTASFDFDNVCAAYVGPNADSVDLLKCFNG